MQCAFVVFDMDWCRIASQHAKIRFLDLAQKRKKETDLLGMRAR